MRKVFFILMMCLLRCYAYADNLLDISSSLNNQNQDILIKFSDKATTFKSFSIGDDLVIDFFGTDNQIKQSQYTFQHGLVANAMLVVSDDRVRMILSSALKYKYTIQQLNNKSIVISFSNTFQRSANRKQLAGIKVANPVNSKLSKIEFHRDDNSDGLIELLYTGKQQINMMDKRLGDKLKITLSADIDKSLLNTLDVTDFATPVKFIETKQIDDKVILEITNRGEWSYAVYNINNKIVINIRKFHDNSSIPNLNNKNKQDGRISFNFQNADVRSILFLLADFGGYNLVVGDGVAGPVSLKLNNVLWDDALNILLQIKGLGLRREGNILRIAPNAELAIQDRQKLDNTLIAEAVQPLEMSTVHLRYAKAPVVREMLTQRFSNGRFGESMMMVSSGDGLLSNRGSIIVDERTNSLFIKDTPSRLVDIKAMIDKIDIPVKQVLIEARIVQTSDTFEQTLGTKLMLAFSGKDAAITGLVNGFTINSAGNTILPSTGGAIGMIFRPGANTAIGLEVDASELLGTSKTLANPKVMTMDNQTASIMQGIQIPYQSTSLNSATTVTNFINAVLSLSVTPQITNSDTILLNADIHKDAPVAGSATANSIPSIDTNNIKTNVEVQDGATVLIGGVYVNEKQKAISQVPWLGDIPILGWLFKIQVERSSKKELLIFITPRIIRDDGYVTSDYEK